MMHLEMSKKVIYIIITSLVRVYICICFTVTKPSSHNVGSGPTEKINRNIVDATNVRIPDSLGKVITIAADASMTVQIKADR